MPKGNLLKQNLPKGVINVVNGQESSDNRIYQNPLFASSLVNTVAPASLPKVSSTEGMGCTSLKMLSFNGVKSTQILTPPDFFGTTTIPAQQRVGVSTLEITPMDSIRSSSCRTLSQSGRGTFQGVYNEYRTVSSLSWILYSSPNCCESLSNSGSCCGG